MWEKFKTVSLVFLIFSSVLLTYRLWFGRPPLEEGTVPRYEYVYFTPLPALPEIVQPAEIIFFEGEDGHLFRRGDGEYQRLWTWAWQILTRKMDLEKVKRNTGHDPDAARETAAYKLVIPFQPPLPLEFISDWPAAGETKIKKIVFLWDKDCCTVFLEGEEIFGQAFLDASTLDGLLPVKSNPCILLPAALSFTTACKPDGATVGNDLPGEAGLSPGGSKQEHVAALIDNTLSQAEKKWEIAVPQEIFLEKESLLATEIFLERKDIPRDDLVKSFFLDLSLARRIEEKDGAVYFTNGEKGLRIYASGVIEYTAPRPGSTFRQQFSYGSLLQKGAESQSLYGGYLPGTYLCEAREVQGGCRLIWRRVLHGLVLEGENTFCEMFLEGQGVSFLRRNFWVAGTEVAAPQPFRSFEEALGEALSLQEDRLPEGKATLLSLRPVYYLPTHGGERATPAWEINFAESGVIYLHWSTLDPL